MYNLNEAEAVLTDNNDIRIYTDGEEKFRALLTEIEKAENYVPAPDKAQSRAPV